jgi:hypothetical protein
MEKPQIIVITFLCREKFDVIFYYDSTTNKNMIMRPAEQIYEIITKFLTVYNKKRDGERMEKLYK